MGYRVLTMAKQGDDNVKRIYCPVAGFCTRDDAGRFVSSDWWIERPAEWMGEHALVRDRAVKSAGDQLGTSDLLTFSVSLALAHDWRLPGLEGNPDKWDFSQLNLRIITWVNHVIFEDFQRCYQIPKN